MRALPRRPLFRWWRSQKEPLRHAAEEDVTHSAQNTFCRSVARPDKQSGGTITACNFSL